MDATYTLLPNGMVRRGSDTFIPNDPANRDRQEFDEWLAAGNKPAVEKEMEVVQPRLPDLDDLLRRVEQLEKAAQRGRE